MLKTLFRDETPARLLYVGVCLCVSVYFKLLEQNGYQLMKKVNNQTYWLGLCILGLVNLDVLNTGPGSSPKYMIETVKNIIVIMSQS